MTIIGIFLVFIILIYTIKSLMKSDDSILLSLCFFFIPFSGVSLYNVPDISFYVLPFTITACLWIVYHLVKLILFKNTISIDLNNSFVLLILLFIVSISFSSLSPIMINGEDGYMGANEDSGSYYPVVPSTIYFLQFFYVFIGAIFSIFVVGYINNYYKVEHLIKILIITSIFTCLLGLFELLTFYMGFDFITGWYHTVPTGDTNEKGVRLDGLLGVPRINSVSYETSNFSQHMLIPYAFLNYCKSYNLIIFSTKKDIFARWIILISLILALSSTAIFGILIIHTLTIMLTPWTFKKIFLIFSFSFMLICFVYFLYVNVEIISQILDFFVFDKFLSGSFESRFGAAYSAYEIFLRHPLIGIGFGTMPPADLIFMLLSGAGILGLLIFFSLILVIIYNGYIQPSRIKNYIKLNNPQNKDEILRLIITSNALTFSLVILMIIYQSIGFTFRFGDFWCLSALVVSAYSIRKRMML